MRKVRILAEYLLAFLVVSILIMAIAGTIVVKFYGKDLQSIVLREINAKLDTRIDVNRITISAFRKFPNASIVLQDITIWSDPYFSRQDFQDLPSDTLLHAEIVFLRINLLDLVRKKYSIKQLDARNGSIFLLTDSKGMGNYNLIRQQEKSTSSKGIFVLNEVELEGFRCTLKNLSKDQHISGSIENVSLSGNFSKRNFRLKVQSDIHLDTLLNKKIVYASNRNLKARMDLEVKDSLYTITNGHLVADGIVAESSGSFIITPKQGLTTHLTAKADNIDMGDITDLLPGSVKERIKGIKGTGKMDISVSLEGSFSPEEMPLINIDFNTSNAEISSELFPFRIRKLTSSGNYNNGPERNPVTSSFSIQSFSSYIDGELIEGELTWKNFTDPAFHFRFKGPVHPGNWIRSFDQKVIAKAEGNMEMDLAVQGYFEKHRHNEGRSLMLNVNGPVELEQINLLLENSGEWFHDLNGTIEIQQNVFKTDLSGYYGDSQFSIKGNVINVIQSLLYRVDPLILTANLSSQSFDLQQVLQSFPRRKEEKSGFIFPANLDLDVHFSFGEFKKERFNAQQFRGIINYDPPLLILDSIQMQTMDGELKGKAALAQSDNGNTHLRVFSDLQHIDIHDLFYTFNNFGQDHITYEHLVGDLSGTTEFTASFDGRYKINSSSVTSKSEVVIRNGELKNFEPIMALSKYIDVEELQDIHFETLQNSVLINERRVIIPQMDIKSNAIDLSASGIHNFDKQYEYRIRLLLSELLYQKARKGEMEEYNPATDLNDTRTLFLRIYNEGRETKVEYDREKAAEKIREDLKEEKDELRQLLNDELGLFRKNNEQEKKDRSRSGEEPMFRFEFDETSGGSDTIREESPRENRLFRKNLRR